MVKKLASDSISCTHAIDCQTGDILLACNVQALNSAAACTHYKMQCLIAKMLFIHTLSLQGGSPIADHVPRTCNSHYSGYVVGRPCGVSLN